MGPADQQPDEPIADAPLAGEIMHGVLDPLLTLDSDLRLNTANPAFYEAFGLEPEQTLGRRLYEVGGGMWDVPGLRQLLAAVHEEDKTFRDYELTVEPESGGRRTLLLNAGMLPSSGSSDPLILLGMKDISLRKETEEALRRREQQLRMIFENARDIAIIAMDLDGRVTAWNAGAERLLGYSEAEIMGRDLRVIFTERDQQHGKADDELETAISKGRAEDERWHVRKDGSRFWGSGLVMPMYEGDDIQGLMKIMRDMTAEHQLRQEREQRARELEQRVAEATAEARNRARQLETLSRHLHQAELRERQRLAQVLHDDLQQLLVATNMRLQMAERQSDPGPALQEARQLAEQAIDTSRTLSHELSPSILRKEGFVAALRWLGENIQERHELPVQVDADEQAAAQLPQSIAEVVFQMVRELLFNVVKHAEASRAWVTVEPQGEEGIRLIVDDDGVGCDPEATAGDPGESGFGLASIRERLTIWHGRLRPEQRPGGGCRMVLEFPLSVGD